MLTVKKARDLAQSMIMAGVRAADPMEAVRSNVICEQGTLTICGDAYDLSDYEQVLLFGIGKAATPMARAFEEIYRPDGGAVITKLGAEIDVVSVDSVPVYRAYHPEPCAVNVEKSRAMLSLAERISPGSKTLVIFMVSGGGSALFCVPPPQLSVDDMYTINRLMMHCGMTIHEINVVRKHLSLVKGGRLGQLFADRGADVTALILSDVVGDDLSIIASGPTYKDDSTYEQAIGLMRDFGIWEEAPETVRNYLEEGQNGIHPESPDRVPEGVRNYLIGNNMMALQAAARVAGEAGIPSVILTSQNTGEAKFIAKCIMGIAKEIQDSGNPVKPPVALIMGGEMTVTYRPEEADGFGPNREFVLSSAMEIAGRSNIVVAGADTDGVDGEGKSGAIADTETVNRASLDAKWHLENHEAEAFFDSTGDSLLFESRTNVNDIDVVIIW